SAPSATPPRGHWGNSSSPPCAMPTALGGHGRPRTCPPKAAGMATERILEFTLPIIRRKIMCRFVTVAVLLAAPTAFAQDLSKEEKADGFVKIFNGKDLTGWTGATERFAVDDDGTLFCKKTKNIENLLTKQEYGDFILRLDYLTTGGCNNGVGLRM